MRIVWTAQAVRDLVEVRAWVAKDDPSAAADLARRILQAAAKLAKHPEMGRRAPLRGIRELVIPGTPYLIPYRVRSRHVELLRVLHGRRLRQPED